MILHVPRYSKLQLITVLDNVVLNIESPESRLPDSELLALQILPKMAWRSSSTDWLKDIVFWRNNKKITSAPGIQMCESTIKDEITMLHTSIKQSLLQIF